MRVNQPELPHSITNYCRTVPDLGTPTRHVGVLSALPLAPTADAHSHPPALARSSILRSTAIRHSEGGAAVAVVDIVRGRQCAHGHGLGDLVLRVVGDAGMVWVGRKESEAH